MSVITHVCLVLFCTLLLLSFNKLVHPATIEEETEAAEIALEDAIIDSVKLDFRVRRNDELFITIVTDDGHKLCDGRITGIASLDQITCTFDPELFERPDIFLMTTIYSMTKKEIVSQSPAHFRNPSFGMMSQNFKRRLLVRRITRQVLRITKDKRVWVGAALASGGYGAFVFLYPFTQPAKQPPANSYVISNFFSKPPSFPPSSPSLKRKNNNNHLLFFSSSKAPTKSTAFSSLFRSSASSTTSTKPSKKASSIIAKPITTKKKQFYLTTPTNKNHNFMSNFQSSLSTFFHRSKQTITSTKPSVFPVKFYLEKLQQSLFIPLFQSLWVSLCVTDYFLSLVGQATATGYYHLETSTQAFYQRMRKKTLAIWHSSLAKLTHLYLWSLVKEQLSTKQGQMLITNFTTTLMVLAVNILSQKNQPMMAEKTWSLPSFFSWKKPPFVSQKITLQKQTINGHHQKNKNEKIVTTAKVIRKSRASSSSSFLREKNNKRANNIGNTNKNINHRDKSKQIRQKKVPITIISNNNNENANNVHNNNNDNSNPIQTWFSSTKVSAKELQEQFHFWPVNVKRRFYVSLTALIAQLCYFSVRKQLDPYLAPHHYHTIQPTTAGSNCLVPFRN